MPSGPFPYCGDGYFPDDDDDDEFVAYDHGSLLDRITPSAPVSAAPVVDLTITSFDNAVTVPQALQRAGRRTLLDLLVAAKHRREGAVAGNGHANAGAPQSVVRSGAKEGPPPAEDAEQPTDLSRRLKHLLPSHLTKQHRQAAEALKRQQAVQGLDISDFSSDGYEQPPREPVSSPTPREVAPQAAGGSGPPRRTVDSLIDCTRPHHTYRRTAGMTPHGTPRPTPKTSAGYRSITDILEGCSMQPATPPRGRRGPPVDSNLFGATQASPMPNRGAWLEGLLGHENTSNLMAWEAEQRLLVQDNALLWNGSSGDREDVEEEDLGTPGVHRDPGYLGKPYQLTLASMAARCITASGSGVGGRGAPHTSSMAVFDPLSPPKLLCEGGRGSSGNSRKAASLNHLAHNHTALHVVQYLQHSFDAWQLNGSFLAGSTAPAEDEEQPSHRKGSLQRGGNGSLSHGTFQSPPEELAPSGSSEKSGVDLMLRVAQVEGSYGLTRVLGEITWVSPRVRGRVFTDNRPFSEIPDESCPGGGTQDHVPTTWSIILNVHVAEAVPLRVGQHLYLAEPFSCYPTLRTILASYTVTSDELIRYACEVYKAAVERAQERRRHRKARVQKSEERQEQHQLSRSGDSETAALITATRPSQRPPDGSSAHGPITPFRGALYDPLSLALDPTTAPTKGRPQPLSDAHQQRGGPATGSHLDATVAPESATNNAPTVRSSDAIGGDFPRGPGPEWDVPVEVLQLLVAQSLGSCRFNPHASTAHLELPDHIGTELPEVTPPPFFFFSAVDGVRSESNTQSPPKGFVVYRDILLEN